MTEVQWLLLTTGIVMIAGMVQGMVGFGFSLIALPLMSLMVPITTAVPLIVCYSLVNNVMVVATTRKSVAIKKIWPMIFFGIMGIPVGVHALTVLNTEVLELAVGLLIVLTSLAMIFGFGLRMKREGLGLCLTGFVSGVLNGSLSMSGPPIVLFLSNQNAGKHSFRGNLAMYALVTNSITIIVFVVKGLLMKEMLPMLMTNSTGLILGTFLGIKAVGIIKDQHFRKTVLMLMTIIGVVTVIHTLY